jgi:hypothetical protein
LKSGSGLYQFDVISVTQGEARNIMRQIRESREAKIERLTGPDVIIKETTVIEREPPAASHGSAPDESLPAAGTRGALAGPTIEILDPPLANTRAITNLITPAGADGRQVVGKIDAPAGLLSLTVNGQPQPVDQQGLFKTMIPLGNTKTPVSVVAVDTQGKRGTVEFMLLPETLQEEPLTRADSGKSIDPEFFGKYYALVIANNQYQMLDNLTTPVNDANTIVKILKEKYGFTVATFYNATRYEIISSMNKMRRHLTEKDNLLIYYAGHGEYDKVNNRGHWLPVDAERDSTANWISTIAISDIINAMSAKHVLVIADSCYSGALTRSAGTELDPGMSDEARNKWLRLIAKTRSRYVLTSGGVKPVLDDSGNGHSIFANAIIDVLSKNRGVLEGSKLFREVKSRIETRAEELNVEQAPQYAKLKSTGHEFGEFLLVSEK